MMPTRQVYRLDLSAAKLF